MNDWKIICSLGDVPPQGSRVVKTAQGDIALFRTADDRVFALDDRCPHKGGPLSQGIVSGARVTCPLHGWLIEFDSGNAVAPDHGCVKRHEARIDAGKVLLRIV
ncbi:MAG: nitrite reductase (NAD(P)H) small subunit [Rhodocyclaceae bacterium]|nr:MAG: nitrite reductase (NAD(P)H) small subunit [Rhodocyclaceae bacterium]